MADATRYCRQAECGHPYAAVRPQGRRHKLCPCCSARLRLAEFMRPCLECGGELGPELTSGRGGRRKYHQSCDPHFRATPKQRPCDHCAQPFQPQNRHNRFCSKKCANYLPVQHSERPCEFSQCGQAFQPKNTKQRSCSPVHARDAWRERNVEREADIRLDVYHRYRARKKGTSSGAPVIRAEIAERDGWACHICEQAISQSAKWPDPFSLSLDHVIPLSKDGIHDPSNVKAAHLQCNVRKGDSLAA